MRGNGGVLLLSGLTAAIAVALVAAGDGRVSAAEGDPVPILTEAAPDPVRLTEIAAGDVEAGRSFAQRCLGCHAMRPEGGDEAGGPQAGPNLFGVFGRPLAAQSGFAYSPALVALRPAGLVWDETRLDTFLADPAAAVPGTAMDAFAVPDAQDRANVIAYLRTLVPEEGAVANPDLIARIAATDPANGQLIAAARCGACHNFAAGEEPLFGPNLYGVVGAVIGRIEGFNYSLAMRTLGAAGAVWSFERLDAFLANPAVDIPGTRMGFAGIASAGDRAAVIAYLRALAVEPVPLTVAEPAAPERIGVVRADLTPLTFSRSQVSFGDRFISEGGCDTCHGAFLRGEGGAPTLIGPEFAARWFNRTVYDLYRYVEGHAGVQNQIAALLVAFILQRNGFRAGEVDLPWNDTALMRGMGFYQ